MGTILMPLIQAVSGIPTIGWARPVMVNVQALRRFSNQRLSHALVAAAGPLSNLSLALLAATLIAAFRTSIGAGALDLLLMLFGMNVGLFVFNLLPIPGLDGSRLLPASLDGWQKKTQPYSWLILLVIVSVPAISAVLIGAPVRFLQRLILSAFGLVAS